MEVKNYSSALFLINPKLRALSAVYEDKPGAKRNTLKTFDTTIKVGDFVIVPTEIDSRHSMTVNKIVEVDVPPDLDSLDPVRWVIDVIDRQAYENLLAQENYAIEEVRRYEAGTFRQLFGGIAELADRQRRWPDETPGPADRARGSSGTR